MLPHVSKRSLIISNPVTARAAQPNLTALRQTQGRSLIARWRYSLQKKTAHRRFARWGAVLINFVLLGVVVAVVILNPSHNGTNPQVAASAVSTPAAAQPVDNLASVDIALTVAGMTNLPEAGAVNELVNSERIQLAVASTNIEVVNKPQVVSSAFFSRKDIHTYVTQPGDTLSSVASKFGVSTDSVIWSNGLTSTTILITGRTLVVPPINGIVYTVKAGDTPSSLATKYHSSESKIIAYNDAELSGLSVGEQIIIPGGEIIMPTYTYGYGGFAFGSSAIYGYNGYDPGNCTWYVASQIQVPANWGNAATWASGAQASGWHVSSTPTPGAIAQTRNAACWGGYCLGHVGIVDAVSADGTQVLIREMNGIGGIDSNGNRVYGGFGKVDIAWQPTSTYQNYITR